MAMVVSKRSSRIRRTRRRASSAVIVLLLLPTVASAGTFYAMQDLVRPGTVGPYAVMHSPGYHGSAGVLEVRVCVASAARSLVGPVQEAMRLWNQLTPT